MKYFLFSFLFVLQFAKAQHKVTGVFTDSLLTIKNVALYKFSKGKVKYVRYVNIKDGKFEFSMENTPPGYYRALYKNRSTGFVEFVYNNKDVAFEVNSKIGQKSVNFLSSRDNQLLDAYNYNIEELQSKLDSIQLAYLQNPATDISAYKKMKLKVDEAQEYYQNLAKEDYVLPFIQASKQNNATVPFANSEDYLEHLKNHYFDAIDADNPKIHNSSLLKRKILNYIYLYQIDDEVKQNKFYLNLIDKVAALTDDLVLKEELLRYAIGKFVRRENSEVVKKGLAVYKTLPKKNQSYRFVKESLQFTKVMVGVKAPDLKLTNNNTLHSIDSSDQYLVIFWSSTCSHCSKELPKVKTLLSQSPKNIKVITVGIEKEKDQEKWKNKVKKYPNWENIMALGKWESKEAKTYNVNATPSYFMLNKDKIIIAKPKNVEELKGLVK